MRLRSPSVPATTPDEVLIPETLAFTFRSALATIAGYTLLRVTLFPCLCVLPHHTLPCTDCTLLHAGT